MQKKQGKQMRGAQEADRGHRKTREWAPGKERAGTGKQRGDALMTGMDAQPEDHLLLSSIDESKVRLCISREWPGSIAETLLRRLAFPRPRLPRQAGTEMGRRDRNQVKGVGGPQTKHPARRRHTGTRRGRPGKPPPHPESGTLEGLAAGFPGQEALACICRRPTSGRQADT